MGFFVYRKEKYEEALRAFRASQTSDPDIADLTRIYAGLSLQKLGLSNQAEAEIAQFGRLGPALPITEPAERIQSNPGPARETDRRFRAEVRFGGFYDGKAPAAPSATGASVPADIRSLAPRRPESSPGTGPVSAGRAPERLARIKTRIFTSLYIRTEPGLAPKLSASADGRGRESSVADNACQEGRERL